MAEVLPVECLMRRMTQGDVELGESTCCPQGLAAMYKCIVVQMLTITFLGYMRVDA